MVILNELIQSSTSTNEYNNHKYDIFISFRGDDTRLTFTNHLYKALVSASLTTFLDDTEIQTGDYLKPEIENAIKTSRASIIVLSKNYTTSTWCLDELVLILDQLKNGKHIVVIPVFYHVDPSDVRKQEGSFGDAMEMYKQKMDVEGNLEKKSQWGRKIESWKKALAQVAELKGKDVKGRKEAEFIEEIVTDIHLRLGVPLSIPLPQLIGMEYFIENISSWVTDRSCHTADILTVLGMSGIGKTSLAKYVFRVHSNTFQKTSFIEDISRRCADRFHGLLDVQKQLYGDISQKTSVQVHDVSVYTFKIANALAHKKALIVLDDIDSLDQLDALIGNKGFHPGSKIIVTTKDASLTERCALFNPRVQPKHTTVLLKGLSETASLKLLCLHAFKCVNPIEGYKEVSEKLVKYCEGHPLALQILGKSLHNRDVAEWEYYISGLKKEPHSRIKKVLQMSFDSLPFKNDKDLFKYIACFFVGKDRDFTDTVLTACNLNTRTGITHLIDRSLLSIGLNNEMIMHSLIQEMGRDVVRQESPEKPWKRSLLWCHEESFKVLKQKKGTENVLGITLDMRMLEKERLRGSYELKTDALTKMDNLRILHLNYVQMSGSYEKFPEELRWLCLHGFPSNSIPSDLPMENLVVLDMSHSKIESFGISCSNPKPLAELTVSCSRDKRLLGSLKILDLSFCSQLRSLGGFGELPALEKLILRSCTSLIEVCDSIEKCNELVLIDLSYCNEFRKLLKTIDKLKTVKALSLDGCSLGELPVRKRKYDSLTMQNANSTGLNSQLTSSAIVEAIPRDLKSFTISLPSSLVMLSLKNNNLSNESFPMDFSCLSMLKDLRLNSNSIVSLPNCVRSLPRLEKLNLSHCKKLMSIEHPPRTLRQLTFYSDVWKSDSTRSLRKVLFDREMSPLTFVLASSSIEFEDTVKIEPLAHVNKNVLHSLGWLNLKVTGRSYTGTYPFHEVSEEFQIQMYYQYGIFSTIYGGKQLPNWITDRSTGPSISFTIPSSPNKLGGFNICSVHKSRSNEMFEYPNNRSFQLPVIRVSNITKNRTWIYHHCMRSIRTSDEYVTFLSHWMFGVNEMEGGDVVIITLKEGGDVGTERPDQITVECGISLLYDDGNIEKEDALGYYKSWNRILGGNLSAFLATTGEYILDDARFCWSCMTVLKHTVYMSASQTLTGNSSTLDGIQTY